MRDIVEVALIIILTFTDTLLIIQTAIRSVLLQYRWVYLITFLILTVTHPISSFVVDSLARLPGLHIISAAITLLFAFSLAGTRVFSYRTSTERSWLWACWTVLWMDALMSVDTIMLVAHTSPSVFVTSAGNMIGLVFAFVFLPLLLQAFQRAVWLQVVVAGYMAYTAARQLGGEPLFSMIASASAVHIVGLALVCTVGLYGWWRNS